MLRRRTIRWWPLLCVLWILNGPAVQADVVQFTVLHTNDFHGNLELYVSNPGAARVAAKIKEIRAAKGAERVLLLDAGDIMQGSLLSNVQRGQPSIQYYKTIGYDAVTFGNHEFDWGQTVLAARTAQSATDDHQAATKEFPFLSANIVLQGTAPDCATAGWDLPPFVPAAYRIFEIPATGAPLRVGVIGVTTQETAAIVKPAAVAGLCFKDPAEAILHYYDALQGAADVLIVLSHLGHEDGGYGYGLPVYGDKTLAAGLNQAGKPVHLIIGGHSHTNLTTPTTVGNTKIVQAYYAGRRLGQMDFTVDRTAGTVSQTWTSNVIGAGDAQDPVIDALVDAFALDPTYLALINQPVFYTNVPITRNYDGDSLMGKMIDDAIYNDLNRDEDPNNDVDMVFNNAGNFRSDIVCMAYPCVVNYGMTFTVLPFGNSTVVGTMAGAQIMELLNQSATLFKGALQTAGVRYKFYRYYGDPPGSAPAATWAWGAYDVEVWDKQASDWVPLDLKRNYRVGTNEFLAPAGQDAFAPFKYMTNITYWGDQLDLVNRWMQRSHPTPGSAFSGALDGRITREGNDATGPVVPVTILHHNDSHGYLLKSGSIPGYSQLVALIKQERSYNPTRTLLVHAGDFLQGDKMMYYFRTAPQGKAADETVLDPSLRINPLIKAFNLVGYDAVTVGNHEFNFGNLVFVNNLSLATFPLLQANVSDIGTYGLDPVGVAPYTVRTVGAEGLRLALLGLGNHRVPHFELPTNIPGLTFSDPIITAQAWVPSLRPVSDAVVALTHMGFTENHSNEELDDRVDTLLADQVSGLDAVIGGHSHTDPSRQTAASGPYQFLPTIVAGPGNTPVTVAQAYRFNAYLGELVLGFKPKAGGGYEVVSRAGRYLSAASAPEDADIVALGTPYRNLLNAYLAKPLGQTAVPLDGQSGFTQETNTANLEADAALDKIKWLGIAVDFHLSGALSNTLGAPSATAGSPVALTVDSAFSLAPYDYSLVVIRLNGPQLKAILERSFRNYYYYKYVPGYGSYTHATACLLDINRGGRIVYRDSYPAPPDGRNVRSLTYRDADQVERQVDFSDAATYYHVSTLNYLVSGACNFNDQGHTLWPLNQIEQDTGYSLRDAVIDYLLGQPGPIAPAVEGRLQFLALPDHPVYLPLIRR